MATTDSELWYSKYLGDIQKVMTAGDDQSDQFYLWDAFTGLEEVVRTARSNGRNIFFAGNGASSTIASHAALDFTNQLGVRCEALNDPSMITAFSNDYGYENFLYRALQMKAVQGDVVVLISSSGQSTNVLKAAEYANKHGITVITLSGFEPDNPLRKLGKVNFWADSKSYNAIETTHMIWLVAVCDRIVSQAPQLVGKHGVILGTPGEIL